MDTKREKLVARNQKVVAGFVILGLIITILFLRYEGEKLLVIVMPQQQVTYYKISELKQENHTAVPQTITLYTGKRIPCRVQYLNSQYDYDEKDIRVEE